MLKVTQNSGYSMSNPKGWIFQMSWSLLFLLT